MPTNKLAALVLATAVAAVATFAFAQDVTPDPSLASLSPEEMVLKRQATMKEDGGLLKAAGGQSGAEAVASAEHLIQNYTNLTVLFPEGSIVGNTKALPAIWEKNADFQAILAAGIAAAGQMKAAAEAGDAAAYGAAMKAMGGTCGQCHQAFRQQS
jgi:cytochrome c556